MLIALSLALLTGACWCLIGITYSKGVDRGLHPAVLTCLNGFGVAAITALRVDWSVIDEVQMAPVLTSMMLSGLAMTASMVCLQTAMKRGGHGLAWAVAQSGLAWPFVVAVVIHGERPGAVAWLGLLAILASLPLLRQEISVSNANQGTRSWFAWAMLAWALIGLQQTAFQWPSLSLVAPDPAGLRVPVMTAMAGISSAVLLLLARWDRGSTAGVGDHRNVRKGVPWRVIAALGFLACLANGIAQPAMIHASDLLAVQGVGGIGFPIAFATCIVLFVLFTCLFRGERPRPRTWIGLGCSLLGVVLLSF